MSGLHWIVLLVAAQRLAELIHARRNERRLLASGGIEYGAAHYPPMVALHAAWLIAMPASLPAETAVDWSLAALYAGLQVVRYWVIFSLGPYWTTRIIVVPGAKPVRRGPYRFLRHPNYMVVAAEVALLPLVFGAWQLAIGFSVLNAAMLAVRLGEETRARAAAGLA